jgi:hypothetical protein
MYVDHEVVEYVAAEEQDFKEVIEEYEEEIFVLKEFQEPPAVDTSDFAHAQGEQDSNQHIGRPAGRSSGLQPPQQKVNLRRGHAHTEGGRQVTG